MSINGITNTNQYTSTQAIKKQTTDQTKTTASAVKASTQSAKSAAYNDIPARISNIPNIEQYGDLIQRFISGESEMESAEKPLTDDQIALRGLMREYMRTDNRSISQISFDMRQSSKNFMDYWYSSGNSGPMPGRMISPDGSFKIFNSKAEKDEYMNNQKMDFLKTVMSVISNKKNDVTNLDMMV